MTEKLNSSNLRQNPRNVNELVNELTLFDDDLMSRVFDKNIKATELLLRIILGKKVKVISVTGQNEMKNHQVGRRNITLDVDAMDENGEEIDIEVQGNSEGAHVRRARYHSSMVDSRMLKEGQAFRELKDSYVIFIYKHDKFRKGLPLYHVERYVGETNEQFRDGSHIIYVNGNYKGNDEIGQLMQDFREKNPECMHYTELAESVKHFKEKEGGREEMSEIVERYGDEAQINQGIEEMAELIQAVNKFRRKPVIENLENIAEEIVDVEIMLEQYKIIYAANPIVEKLKNQKLQRLASRLGVKDYD